jgi:hypothetical protein
VAGLEAIPVKPPFLPFQRLAQFFVFFWNFFPGLPAGGLFFTRIVSKSIYSFSHLTP